MKKDISLSIAVSMFITSLCPVSITANAESDAPQTFIEYYDNGYYAEITISTDYSSQYQIDAVTSVKSGTALYEYRNPANQVEWTYTLHGTFSYDGTSASCIDVSDDYNIIAYYWSCGSHSCWPSGNTAYGTVTMNKSILGTIIDSETKNITLSCTPSGTLYY